MRRSTMTLILIALLFVAVVGFRLSWEDLRPVSQPVTAAVPMAPSLALRYRPIIDAGHGGIDGGAVSCTGVNESHINLEIALKTELMMRFLGLNPMMTRETDISLHDADAGSIAGQKRSDLANRAAMVNNSPNSALISIHQNTFEQSQYSGAQVFYNAAAGSKAFAEQMQEALRAGIDTQNDRQSKTIDVYMMKKVTRPAILIECGFLSNAREEANLRDEIFQTRLALVVTSVFLGWAGETDSGGE